MSRTFRRGEYRSLHFIMIIMMMIAGSSLAVLMSPADSAQASSCSSIRVAGRATNNGHALKRYGVMVTLHAQTHPLAGTRTGRNGGYSITFCRSSKLATYARRHSGHINLDVLSHAYGRKSKLYVRVVGVPYRMSTIHVQGKLVAVPRDLSPMTRSSVGSSRDSSLGTSVISPPLMRVQVVKYMHADYSLSASSIQNIETTIGTPDGQIAQAAGTIALGGNTGFESNRTLATTKHQHKLARLIEPELAINNQQVCELQGTYFGGTYQICHTESSGDWTGNVTAAKTPYMNCSAGNAPVLFFSNRRQLSYDTNAGVTFSSSAKVSVLGSSVVFKADYGDGTRVHLAFDHGGKKHQYCIGGDGTNVQDSAALYTTLLKPTSHPSPCSARIKERIPCRQNG